MDMARTGQVPPVFQMVRDTRLKSGEAITRGSLQTSITVESFSEHDFHSTVVDHAFFCSSLIKINNISS
jgi:hypothetical protein